MAKILSCYAIPGPELEPGISEYKVVVIIVFSQQYCFSIVALLVKRQTSLFLRLRLSSFKRVEVTGFLHVFGGICSDSSSVQFISSAHWAEKL
jgi:hypothetical protein